MDFRITLILASGLITLASCKVNENAIIYVEKAITKLEQRGTFKQKDAFLLNSLYLNFALRDRFIEIDSVNVLTYLNIYKLDRHECLDRVFDTELIELERPYSSIAELINSKSSNLYNYYIKKEGIPPFSKRYNPYFLIYRNKVFVVYSHSTIPDSAEVYELKDSITVTRKFIYLLLD